jgi:phosphatidate cytidylyltransferase
VAIAAHRAIQEVFVGDQSGFPPPDEQEPDSEGVRLIGPDEAAEAVERGDVVRRRSQDAPKFGDRPPKPEGPRPTLRFPLSDAANPSDIERPRPAAQAPTPPPSDNRSLFSVGEGEPSGERAADRDVTPERQPDGTGEVELPHWTEPATGEVPRVIVGDDDDDAEAWAALAANAPRWRDSSSDYDDSGDDLTALIDDDEIRVGALDQTDRPTDDEMFSFDEVEESPRRQADRSRAGAARGPRPRPDEPAPGVPAPRAERRPSSRPSGGSSTTPPEPPAERNLPVAVGVGVVIAAFALVLFSRGPAFATALVVGVLFMAAAEFFTTIRRAGYQPAQLLGLAACAAFPLAAYWRGEAAFPLMIFLVVLFGFLWYLAGAGDEHPVMNLGVTLLGVAYIGGLGSFATLILRDPIDHDGVSLLLALVLVAVAYDIGAFFVGRQMGATPLSEASPSKTWEGVGGGAIVAVLVSVLIVGVVGPISLFGDSLVNSLALALVVIVTATIGDLAESVMKRDLGVKDMGNLLPGHGGLLDRFDGLLFALPAAFYLAQMLR